MMCQKCVKYELKIKKLMCQKCVKYELRSVI